MQVLLFNEVFNHMFFKYFAPIFECSYNLGFHGLNFVDRLEFQLWNIIENNFRIIFVHELQYFFSF